MAGSILKMSDEARDGRRDHGIKEKERLSHEIQNQLELDKWTRLFIDWPRVP